MHIHPDTRHPVHRRFHDIDVLRFLAAVSVMLLHYLVRGFADGDIYSPVFYGDAANLVKYNYLAVNLFFMISGFVILMTAEGGTALSFLRSRLLRLYPAYWFCCTVSFVLTYFFINHIFTLTVPRYLFNLTMFNGFFGIGYVDGVYWTLLVELKFYLLVLCVLLLRKMPKIEYLLAGWLLICVFQAFCRIPLLDKYLITNYASFFIAGCLFYRLSKLGFSWFRAGMLLVTVPVGVHFEVADLAVRAAHYNKLAFHGEMVAGICIGFYVLFIGVILRRSSSPRYAKLATRLGSLSYPLYLIHLNVGLVIFNLVGEKLNKWLLLPLICVGMIAFAYFIHRCVEKPLSAFMKRKLPPPSVPATAPV